MQEEKKDMIREKYLGNIISKEPKERGSFEDADMCT